MRWGLAAIVAGLAVAGLAAGPLESILAKPAAAKAAKIAGRTTKSAARKSVPAHARKTNPMAVLVNAYAAMPDAERRAIQSDLALLGAYEGKPGGDFDEHTIAAVRAFQKRSNAKETGVLAAPERDGLAAAAQHSAEAVGWRLIEDPVTGARLGIPEKLAAPAGPSRSGSRWASAQRQIQIETFRIAEGSLPALFDEEKKAARRQIESSALKADSFVISGVQGLKNFVMRAETNGSELRGVTVLYDQATKGIMASVAIAIANTFTGFPDPNVRPAGLRRNVEYGTAIVVSAQGDVLASAALTSECQAIMVPGLGYAERVADDSAADLALLRLHGARNLSAAPLAGSEAVTDGDIAVTGTNSDVTVVGVADPLAQAGDGAVTRAAARLADHGIAPVPKPGFSGAAVVDGQDRLVGIVDLKPAVVAGAGVAAVQQATLVPADTIRVFLQAQGVKPTAATATTIEQAVVRVVCVRK
jgi:peptidoglycan hydrolase-like protein with peptidoglycan-binding domain